MSKFSYFPKDKTKTAYGRCEAEDINMLGNELLNAINSANLTPSMNETDQLAKAISNYIAKGTFCKDVTTDYAHINLQIQTPFKAPNAYYDGMIITFLPMNINLLNATVNVNGLGEKPIREEIYKDGIAVGVIAPNQYIQLIYNQSLDSFIIFLEAAKDNIRRRATPNYGAVIIISSRTSYTTPAYGVIIGLVGPGNVDPTHNVQAIGLYANPERTIRLAGISTDLTNEDQYDCFCIPVEKNKTYYLDGQNGVCYFCPYY